MRTERFPVPLLLKNLAFLATFRELGPPDLCHVQKSTGRSGSTDVIFATFTSVALINATSSLVLIITSPESMHPPLHH